MTAIAGVLALTGEAAAQRAATPADATVFIRLVGSVHAELDEAGAARRTADVDRIEIGTGSGFVISPHGYVLTNEHVISNSEFEVTDGPRKAKFTLKVSRIDVCFPAAASAGSDAGCFEASVHSADPVLDLAVLFISASDLPYVALGDSDIVRSGQSVEALGYPFGRQLEVARVAAPDLVPEISTSPATVAALRAGEGGDRRALQINGTINPGNSGGPLVDRDGFAVGVIRARVTNNSGIGFAIPINQVKGFLESRGLEPLMPVRRFRLGPLQSLDGKGMSLRLPDGLADISPARTRVETDPGTAPIALRIDRAFSPWTARQLERTLVSTQSFERLTIESNDSQSVSRVSSASILLGRATGMPDGSDAATRMLYGVMEVGAERLIARYVGPEEQLAYNESVLRDSLLSLDAQRMTGGRFAPVEKIEWVVAPASSGQTSVPFPAGWVFEPTAPTICNGLPPAGVVTTVYPSGDVTLALRSAVWEKTIIEPSAAANACSSRRGTTGEDSYLLRAEWLGVAYSIEGLFVRVGSRHMQLEVISPEQRSAAARTLLAAWAKRVAGQ
jgi:S1-C subfamily serine protease